jgi:hypothetical protein
MRWRYTNRGDHLGCALADRHYSRTKVGAPQFGGNGSILAMLAPVAGDPCALWVTKWQRYVRTEWWLDVWVCSLFRNEGAGLSSELITEAVAATRAVWGEPPPRGFTTFVDPDKTRRKRDPGRCYRKAGWEEWGETDAGLVVLGLSPDRFPQAKEPADWQRPLFTVPRLWKNALSRNVNADEAA